MIYYLERKNVKNINIRINQDNIVIVSASRHISESVVEDVVKLRFDWINKHLKLVGSKILDNQIYTNKTIYYYGNQYSIKVVHHDSNFIKLDGVTILIYSIYTEKSEQIRKQYLEWLKERGQVIFDKCIKEELEKLESLNICRPEFSIRNMRTRWGSCTVNRSRIRLNLQLVKTSHSCIQQVVLHELLHFVHPNHSRDFYELMNKYMPDWKSRRLELETKFKDGI